ncbi:MAG: DUF1501 domain-containing protein, partial [Planctomycetaceae bacterium]
MHPPRRLSRREWLAASGCGFGSMAFSAILADEVRGAAAVRPSPGQIGTPRVKRVVQLFMAGAASHIDLFDYKPALVEHHGKPSDFGEPVEAFQNGLGPWLRPVWGFRPFGQCGKLLSDVVAPLGDVVDRIAFIHNMVSPSGVHSAATLHQTTGFVLPGFPGSGCWVSYALGSDNENLPTFVVLPDHRGFGSNGVKIWVSGFLPAHYRGTWIQPDMEDPIADLRQNRAAGGFITLEADAATRAVLERLNRRHVATRDGDSRLEGRIASYELAARMQLAAPESLGLDDEPEHILRLYWIDRGRSGWPGEINAEEESHHFGLRCLTARR